MDTDAWLAILKMVGAVIGAILGIAGLLLDFKSSNGRLSRAGVAVLTGIVLSGLVGVGGSIVEAYKARSDSAQQAARTEQLLHEINRAVQPITELHAYYWVEIVPKDKITQAYIDRLRNGIEERVGTLRRLNAVEPNNGLSAVSSGADGDPYDVEITDKSDLWPTADEEFIGATAKFLTLSVYINKAPVEPYFAPIDGVDDFSAYGIMPRSAALTWDRRKGKLYVVASMDFNKDLWSTTGKIRSLIDLQGAQIELTIPTHNIDVAGYTKSSLEAKQVELANSLKLRMAALTFSEGRTLWFRGENMKEIHMPYYVIFVATMPQKEMEFHEFTASRDD